MANELLTITNTNLFNSSYGINTQIEIPPIKDISSLSGGIAPYYGEAIITVTTPKGIETISTSDNGGGGGNYTFTQSGSYQIRYSGYNVKQTIDGDNPRPQQISYSFYYNISVIENHLPLKQWTVTAVVNRLLELAEPLRKGEKLRFRFNEEQAERFDNILAPQFSFTKQTLRECLQDVGGFIHGEAKLTPKKYYDMIYTPIRTETFTDGVAVLGESSAPYQTRTDYSVSISNKEYTVRLAKGADGAYALTIVQSGGTVLKYSGELTVRLVTQSEKGTWYYEVSYDMYTQNEKSGIMYRAYASKSSKFVIDHYAGYVDSNAENLVNVLDPQSGVIVEPYAGGAKTVRTGNMYVRITDGNMLIPTQFPIYSVEKLEYVYADGEEIKSADITAYLFEKSVYDSQLSSYAEAYPYSKAYGLYYTQGGKNIEGLSFKVDSAAFPAFKNYAITNILKQVIGESYNLPDYPLLTFRVTYTPFYNARISQTKVNYKDFRYPAAMIVNQSANVIESRYYGENLKGTIARIGNIEHSLTYPLMWVSQIPKAGQKFNDDFYISAVAAEFLPTYIRCTIGLSKDYNRISKYIGVSSVKRYSEISQGQAVERNTLWREYIVIGDEETPDSDTVIGNGMLGYIAQTFRQDENSAVYPTYPLSSVTAWGESYKQNPIPTVTLPVISAAYGNSMSFSWEYEDNYSAGAIANEVSNAIESGQNKVTGYFQNNSRYTDFYGRIYYYYFNLAVAGEQPTAETLTKLGQDLPQTGSSSVFNSFLRTPTPYILRKDNREKLKCNFQIDFVSNQKDFIIGSALAANCPAVRGVDSALKAEFYVFDELLNKFTDNVESANGNIDLSDYTPYGVIVDWNPIGTNPLSFSVYPNFPSGIVPEGVNGKSWAIVTHRTETEGGEVEDEYGTVSPQTKITGGDLIIGRNIAVTAGEKFRPIYFTVKHDVFDKTVWKDTIKWK